MPILLEDKCDIDYTRFKTPQELAAYVFSSGDGHHRTKITKSYPVVITPKGKTIDFRGQNIDSRFKVTITNLVSLASGTCGLVHFLTNLIR